MDAVELLKTGGSQLVRLLSCVLDKELEISRRDLVDNRSNALFVRRVPYGLTGIFSEEERHQLLFPGSSSGFTIQLMDGEPGRTYFVRNLEKYTDPQLFS
jgi:hypothetical protein